MYLNRVEQRQRQDVLDEWHGRLHSAERRGSPIDNPLGYFAGLCRGVGSGEFQITIGLKVRENRNRDAQRAREQKQRDEQEQQRRVTPLQVTPQPQGERRSIERRIHQIREKTRLKQEGHGHE